MEEKNKLFVGNLSFDIDDNRLAEIFRSASEEIKIVDVRVIIDKFSGKSKGFGFVTLETEEMAQTAIGLLNGQEVDGRQIFVNIAKPMEKRDNNRRDFNRGGGNSYRNSYR